MTANILWIERFRDDLKARGMSSRTVAEYPSALEKYLQFLEEQDCDVLESESRDLLDYQQCLLERIYRGKKLSLSTVRSTMDKLRSFYRYLVESGHLKHDPSLHLKLPRKSRTLPKSILTEKEMQLILDAPDFSPLGLRDRAMMEMMYSCGLRSFELRHLKLSELDLQGRKIRFIGKGSKEAILPFGEMAAICLNEYLQQGRPKILAEGGSRGGPKYVGKDDFETVFLSRNGHPLNSSNLVVMIKKYAVKADVPKITPHGFRHSCATHLLRRGADIRQIQRLLRHADLSTTQIYTRVDVSDLQELVHRYHPRERKGRVFEESEKLNARGN